MSDNQFSCDSCLGKEKHRATCKIKNDRVEGSTASTSIDLEENDLKPNPTDFPETGASDGFKINIAAWKKELFYLSLALLMLGTVVRASIQLFDHQDIETCRSAAWNQNVQLPLILVFVFWVVPATLCLLVIPVLIFSVCDTFRSGGFGGGGGGGSLSDNLGKLKCKGNFSGGGGSGDGAAFCLLYILFMPLYFFAGGISSTVIMFSNQWAPPLPDVDMPSPPLMELYHSQCENIPPIVNTTWLSAHRAALVSTGSVVEGDVSSLGLVTRWVSILALENADKYRRTYAEEECRRLGLKAWAGAEFVPLTEGEVENIKVASQAGIAAKMAVRAPFCTRNATTNTFTYVETTLSVRVCS